MNLPRDKYGKPSIPLRPEDVYRFGHLIRLTEELILEEFRRGLVSGTTHTCIGQEICQMSVVRALNHPEDLVFSNHRNHGHFLTYSGDFTGLVAEVLGREAGVCGGRGGSQHIAWRHFHSNGVQGGMAPIAVGEALARKLKRSGAIAATFIGDGTLGEGVVYEAMNLAAVWNLPALFVVEDNGIAQTTATERTTGGGIAARGAAFGLRTWEASDEGEDFLERVEEIAGEVRETGRPGFLVIHTRRLGPHSKGDDLREEGEIEAIRSRDPLTRLGRTLAEERRTAIEAANQEYVESVRAAAEASPPAQWKHVPAHIFCRAPEGAAKELTRGGARGNVRAALNEKLRELLARDERTILVGEDLHDPYGGAFKVTAGLSTEYPDRVLSTPISEAGIVGAGIGLAMAGFLPVCEVMFADFVSLTLDQLYNHAVKFPFLFPEVEVPLVVRTPAGGRRGYGPTHSQSPENLLTSVPGLTVVAGSHRHDNGELLEQAVSGWPYPTVFLEHKLLYGMEQSAEGYEVLPAAAGDPGARRFPTLRRARGGADVTIVTFGGMLPVAEEAARQLEEQEELVVELIVPSLLSPLPRATLLAALAGARRVAIVEESHPQYGVGSEMAAMLLEAGFRGKAIRIGTAPVPIPAARSLEAEIIPGKEAITNQILKLL